MDLVAGLNPAVAAAVDSAVEQLKLIAGIAISALALVAVVLLSAGSSDGTPPPAGKMAFSWVRPSPLPRSWSTLQLPGSPARLPVPPGWHPAHGDPGTRTAELTGANGAIAGYLNATPRQGRETLENWDEFRVEHNRDEEEREVELLASATGLAFAGATGSCVLDSYLTSSGRRYREIACIVAGHSATTVIVAAAPPQHWAAEQADLRRAIKGFTT